MKTTLSRAGRSFIRSFLASLIVLLPGVLAAPNLDEAFGLGVAALIASVTAGLKVIQSFVPQITAKSLLAKTGAAEYGDIVDSFVRAFLGSLIVLIPGLLNAPDLSTAKSLAVAAIIGAVTAGIRAVQGFLSSGEVPAPGTGA